MKFFGLVVARSGSKGLPNKNVLPYQGKPLLQIVTHTLVSSDVDECVVSTDDDVYAEIATKAGAGFVSMRPASLSQDTSAVTDVISYEIDKNKLIAKGFTHIVLVQPTSPLVSKSDINRGIDLVRSGSCSSVVSAYKAQDHTVNYSLFKTKNGKYGWLMGYDNAFGNRQMLQEVLIRCGNCYIVNIEAFKSTGRLISEDFGVVEVPAERSLCIDTHADYQRLVDIVETSEESRAT